MGDKILLDDFDASISRIRKGKKKCINMRQDYKSAPKTCVEPE